MNVRFGNCAFSYKNEKGKPIYVPTKEGRRIGKRLKRNIERVLEPDAFYYHLAQGGHVRAIHSLRSNRYFARLDLENFFYSIGRNRVARSLREVGIEHAEHFAKWSTVKNPYEVPSYSTPYGFVQSPILASLVLMKSGAGVLMRKLSANLVVSVYVDDIALSSNSLPVLEESYIALKSTLTKSKFSINEHKSVEPGTTATLFNCHLEHMLARVTNGRREIFYDMSRTAQSIAAFEKYCASIESGNRAEDTAASEDGLG